MWKTISKWLGIGSNPTGVGVAPTRASDPLTIPADIENLLRDIGTDEDNQLIHGMGRDLQTIPAHLERVKSVLCTHFDRTDELRVFLTRVLTGDSDSAVVHGAIKILKKIGAGEIGGTDCSERLHDPLIAVLHRPPIDDDLYNDALTLLSYCDVTSPLSASERQRIIERSSDTAVSDLVKFQGLVRMIRNRWQPTASIDHIVVSDGFDHFMVLAPGKPMPEGWEEAGKRGSEEECMAFITQRLGEIADRHRLF